MLSKAFAACRESMESLDSVPNTATKIDRRPKAYRLRECLLERGNGNWQRATTSYGCYRGEFRHQVEEVEVHEAGGKSVQASGSE